MHNVSFLHHGNLTEIVFYFQLVMDLSHLSLRELWSRLASLICLLTEQHLVVTAGVHDGQTYRKGAVRSF